MTERVTLKNTATCVAVYLQTLADSVQDEVGNLLKSLALMFNADDALKSFTGGVNITVQSIQSIGQNTGDFWYEII